MVQYIQLVGINTATELARVAPARVVAIDPEAKRMHLHDGVTPGGHVIIPADQMEEYAMRLFDSAEVWSGGSSLSNLGGKLVFIGAGTFTFEQFTELQIGEPIYLMTGSSAATLNVFDSDNESFRIGSNAAAKSLAIAANTRVTLVKINTGIVLLFDRQAF